MKQSTGVYLTSYVDVETSDLLRWVAYHRAIGVSKIKLWVLPRYKSRNLLVATLHKYGIVEVAPLTMDAGAYLKTASILLTLETPPAPETMCVALENDEYLILNETLASDIDAVTLPVHIAKFGSAHNITSEFRTIFKAGVFKGHTGERPFGANPNRNLDWRNGAGAPMDQTDGFWGDRALNLQSSLGCILRNPTEDRIINHAIATRQEIASLLDHEDINAAHSALLLAETPEETPALEEAPAQQETPNPAPFEQVLTATPPPWFIEIYPGGEQRGFLKSLEHHALMMIERGSGTLVVTFDNLSSVYDKSFGRLPWGYKYLRDQGHSNLAIMARRKDWYRDPALITALEALKNDGLFERFENVVFAGTSMGGFAALVFSSLSPGATVLALSPQSTLDETIVPWEPRFGMGRQRNWNLAHSDAAFEIDEAKQVIVLSDPYHKLDQRHIDRIQGDNVLKLKTWYADHFSPVFLQRAELLKPIFGGAIDGTLTEEAFYKLYRNRRNLYWYRKALETRLIETGHAELAKTVGPAFIKLNRQKT